MNVPLQKRRVGQSIQCMCFDRKVQETLNCKQQLFRELKNHSPKQSVSEY